MRRIAVFENGAMVVRDALPGELPEADPVADLAAERAAMVISPLQGKLTLGETEWAKVVAYRDTASWAEKVIVDSSLDWRRNSQNIAFFGYLLNYTPEQMDDLFRAAATVEV
jgi:hypothetical protein